MKKFFSICISALVTFSMVSPVVGIKAEDNGSADSENETVQNENVNKNDDSISNETEHTHTFGEVQYVWSDDYSSLTATRKCTDENCGYEETENATVTTTVEKEASCVETGEELITGTFANPAFVTQTQEIELPETAHQLKEVKSDDGTTEYWMCEVCGQLFSDENATNVITESAIAEQSASVEEPYLNLKYTAHVQNKGWMSETDGGQIAGTTGRALHLEALKINAESNISGSIQYRGHVANVGWQNAVNAGEIAGTTGRNLGMEAIEISLTGDLANYFDIYYRVHSANIGWLSWAKNGQRAGTQGFAYSMEAIQIVVVKKDESPNVDTSVPFKKKGNSNVDLSNAYVSTSSVTLNIGETTNITASTNYTYWNNAPQGLAVTASNGNVQVNATDNNQVNGWSGTLSSSIEIHGISKGYSDISVRFPDGSSKTINVHVIDPNSPDLSYSAHVENIGWQGYVEDGDIAGTTGRALRIEALKINLTGSISGNVEYRAHVQNIGWKSWVSSDQVAGTTGCRLPMEAVSIRLTGEMANNYDIYYRVHSSDFGWLGWAKNGEDAGTQGYAKQMEAIQIVLVTKNGSAPGSTANAFYYRPPVRSFPYYNQKDPRWSSINIGGNTIGSTGCGTCVYSMAFSSILNRTILPPEMASYLHSVGEFNNHNPATGYWGTTGRSHLVAAQHYGVHCDVLHSWDEMVAALQANKIISICVGPGRFFYGSGSHELLMYGTNINSVQVLDPLTRSNCHNYSAFEVYQQRSTDSRDWDAGGVVYAFY